MQICRSKLLRVSGLVLASVSTLPSQALAAWGDENWGTMVWGESLSVPSLPGIGLIALAVGLAATAAWLLGKRRLALGLPVLLVLLVVVASTATAVPNTFVNGTVADADEVNENFSSLEARITATETALGISPTARFVACPDGVTVADTETGLLWERKTTDGSVHDVTSTFTWSSTGSAADGTAYTVFLADLNTAPGHGFAGHTDWRLPFISELQSIMVGEGVTTVSGDVDPPDPAMGTNPTGQATVLIIGSSGLDPVFAAVGGPTASSFYWSASSGATSPNGAWFAGFDSGFVGNGASKSSDLFVRAVRAGSCSS